LNKRLLETRWGRFAEELSDDLYGEDLGIGELWGRPAPSDALSLEPVIDEAQDGNDESAKIRGRRPPLGRGWFGRYRA
jgi:hypothetical protein